MIRSGKLRILSTFILALALVAQPFSMLAGTAYAASDYPVVNSEVPGDFSLWSAWDDDATITTGTGGALSGDNTYTYINKSVYTKWGGYESIFPNDGYATSVDVYLDTAMAEANPGKHFDFSSAINNASGTHLRDFAFNVGAADGKWYITANTGADAASVINSETPGAVEVSTSGWYTLRTDFNNNEGVLEVLLSAYTRGDEEGDLGDWIGDWTLSDSSDVIGTVVGGHRYSWFVNQQFENLPVDNATLTTYGDRMINNIDTGETFNTIQQAIDDSDTVAGNTIEIEPGTYRENLIFNKAVTLMGPNAYDGERTDEATIVGQITVLVGGVTIDGLTITNPDYSGPSIKGVQVYGSGAGISDITVKHNIFTDIVNGSATKGAYGVLVQGPVSGVEISNNRFDNITSGGWAHAVEVTTANGVATSPTDISVIGNSFSGTTDTSGTDQRDFSVSGNGTDTANASEITFRGNSISGTVQNTDTAHVFDATANWWGEGTGTTGPVSSRKDGEMIVAPWCSDASCVDTYVVPGAPVQLIVNEGAATTSTFLSLSPVGQPTITALISEGTTITSSDPLWDGTIKAPEVTNYQVPGLSTTALSLSVGSSEHSLLLSNSAQLRFPGQAGKKIGFLAPEAGSVFTEITAVCNDPYSQSAADAQLGVDGACKIDDGNDLVVWTKHFTTFATFTPQVVTPAAATTSSKSKTRSTSFFGVTTYDDTWMDGAAGLQSAGKVKSDNAGVSSTSTFAAAATDSADTKGATWYWWLLGAALLAAAWPAYNALRARYFNR